MHHNNIHALAIEMYKVANDMSSDIMNGILKSRNTPHHNLRHTSHFSRSGNLMSVHVEFVRLLYQV